MNRGDDDDGKSGPERTEVVTYEEAAARRAKKLGRYTLERIIAEGGMAEIWLATRDGPKAERVVVKRIRPELVRQAMRQGGDDGANVAMEMFVREARLLASLEHPNIVQVFEFGVQPSRSSTEPPEHFIIMEVLDGLSLRDLALRLWQANRPLPVEAVVQIVADACRGLEHAHRLTDERGQPANLVHRDISPDNIFVTTTGLTKLLDFGIAKREDWSNLTVAGELKGKVPYMAPEQLKGLRVDGRTDLFAVGVVLYWLLAGRRPFDGPSDVFTMKAILDDDPTPLRTANPRIPALVADLVMSCLAKEPDQRISSAAALHDALSMVLMSARGRAPDLRELVLGAMELPGTIYELVPEIAAAPVQHWPGSGTSRAERRAPPSFEANSLDPSTELVPDIGRRVKEIVLNPPRTASSEGRLNTRVDLRGGAINLNDDPVTLVQADADNLPTMPPGLDPAIDGVLTGEEPRTEPGAVGAAGPVGADKATLDIAPVRRADPSPVLDASPTVLDMPFPAAALAAAAARTPSARFAPPPPPMTSSLPASMSTAPRTPSRSMSPTAPTAPVRARGRRRRWQRLLPPLLAGSLSAVIVLVGLSVVLGLWDRPVAGDAAADAGPVAVATIVDAGAVAVVVDAGTTLAVVDAGAVAAVADVVVDAGVAVGDIVVVDAGAVIDVVEQDVATDDKPARPTTRKKPTPPQKAVKGKGFLVVRARPWAKLSVDGVAAGTTPLPALSLSAGRHRLRLEHEGVVKTRTVDVVANQTATLQIDMREP